METHPVKQLLSRFWWLILLRGIVSILFGVIAIAWPGQTLVTIAMMFAAFVFIDGIFEVVHALGHRQEIEHWGLLLMEGVFGIIFGALALQAPELTTAIGGVIIVFYIAAWAIITGVIRIAMAVRLCKEIEGEWLLGLGGVVSILFGILMMARPSAGALALLYIVAGWAILVGAIQVAFAFRMRQFRNWVSEVISKVKDR